VNPYNKILNLSGDTMKKPGIGISLEGMPFIGLSVLATITMGLLECHVLAIIFLILTFFVMNFFRDPERVVPDDEKIINWIKS
jgi:phosphatidylserine decarboxylase